MKKILLTSLFFAGIGTLIPAFVSANIQGSYKARVDGSSTQWFLDQESSNTPLSQNQCAGAWVSKNYYMPGDYNSDGVKDYGVPLYLRDNFTVVGGTVPTYLVGVRTNGYGGSAVRYQLPSNANNVLRVLNGTQTYALASQSAWYRLSKTVPKDVWVRAVESEPMLVSAPSSNSINDRSFQIAYQIRYRAFQSSANGTSDYDVWPVSNRYDMGGLSQYSHRWALKNNWTPWPDRQADYQQTSSLISTQAIQWNATEIVHPYECFNVTTHWCGDGIVDNTTFDNVTASEQCDLGSQNGQPGSACTASCQNVPQALPPDVTVIKAVSGSNIQGQNVTYTITYKNIGSGAANNVTVTDTLDAGLTFISNASFPSAASVVSNPNGTTTITWNIGNMPAGSQGVIRFDAQIKSTVPNCSTVLNKVQVAASNEPSQFTFNNSYEVTWPIQCNNPQLQIQKDVVASTGGYLPNGYAIYTITYKNIGSGTANGVTVTDTLPSDVTYHTAFPTPTTVNGQSLTWNIGNLPPGAEGVIKVYIKINANVPICQNYTILNKARIQATNANSAEDDAVFMILCGNPFFDVNIRKSVNKTVVTYGENVIYTLTVTNEADATSPITGYTVNDYLPGGVDYVGNPVGPGGMTTTLSGTKDITFGNLPPLAPGQSITISFEAKYVSSTNETNYTEVCTYNGVSGTGVKDRDSNPCNRGRNSRIEDDEDQVTIGPGTNPPGQNPECQGLSASPDVSNLNTSAANTAVQYECRTTWGAYPVSAVLNCGNGQIFTGTTINGNPFRATCSYTNPTNTRAVCVVANRPNPNCELPVRIRTGGGGSSRPYCGDGLVQAGEVCDPGNPLLGIRPAGVPAGKVCGPDCNFRDRPQGTPEIKCSYIDPPAINVGEHMPYWWDMEYDFYQPGGAGYLTATSNCSATTGDTRINKSSLLCEFVLTGPNGVSKRWEQQCYSNPNQILINTAFETAQRKYGLPIPGGRSSVQITGQYYLGLGEYKIEMRVIEGFRCDGQRVPLGDRVCQMNFGVTKQYAVSRSTRGTYASTNDLNSYQRQDNSKVLQTNELIKVLEPFTLVTADKNLITQMVNKYVNLAVKASEIDTKLNNNATATKAVVSKVPGKNIFVIDAKGGTITVLENSNFKDGAFTLIVINGNLTIKGDLTKNPNGMFIVRDGTLTFSAVGEAKENNQNQTVKGIFIGLQDVKAEGDGYQPAFNNDLNKPWVNGGRLTINGILLGGDLTKLVAGRRSVVENWFDKRTADGLLEDGSIVIKANPEIFTALPPGAEDISLTLNVFKN